MLPLGSILQKHNITVTITAMPKISNFTFQSRLKILLLYNIFSHVLTKWELGWLIIIIVYNALQKSAPNYIWSYSAIYNLQVIKIL